MVVIVVIAVITSKFNSKKQIEIKKKIRLFPFWVKYLGIVISLLSIIIHWRNLSDEPSALSTFWNFGLVIGLLIIGLSKERNEDEMTMSIRLYSAFMAFVSGIMAHMFTVLSGLLFDGEAPVYDTLHSPMLILILYVIVFHFTKTTLAE